MELNKNHLSQEQFEVTQNCGTEPPFSGELLYEKREGIYSCVVCDFSLFESDTKFESGTGWPSFYDALDDTITTKEDLSYGMKRVEISCRNCNAHLGHVFPDGPRPTGLRYCVNSLSLSFNENESSLHRSRMCNVSNLWKFSSKKILTNINKKSIRTFQRRY